MYKRRVLEVNGDVTQISLPIVKFPPFKLRALLIEKDPVVWLHCLETYVTYVEYLLHENNVENIDEMTYNNMCMFIRSYLHEMAEEKSKLLSLGMNHDVTEQLRILKLLILSLIKRCGISHLQIFGEALWALVKVYVEEDPTTVRLLLDGSLKPTINTQKAQLSRIPQVQQYLRQLVESGKFNRIDLISFEYLMSDKPLKPNRFGKEFLSTSWLEILELWWAKGQGRFGKIAQELEVITLLSVSANDIVDVTKEMGVSSMETIALYPLLGSLLVNEEFQKKAPGLIANLPFLNFCSVPEESNHPVIDVDESSVSAMSELFPYLSKYQLFQLLEKFEGNVQLATNAVFEDPSIADSIPREASDFDEGQSDAEDGHATEELEVASSSTSATNEIQQVVKKQVPDELRNKTLTWAMQLMYQADEDERDDTYDEAEVTRSVGRISIGDENVEVSSDTDVKEGSSTYDRIEGYLWDLLKQDKTLFERSKRGSKVRKDMKKDTNWSDEQIEGWARMLEKSPQRARILEEKYMFRGNVKTGKTAYVKNEHPHRGVQATRNHNPPATDIRKGHNSLPADNKRQQARNEKQKSSRANHNRKSGHDKKISRAGV